MASEFNRFPPNTKEISLDEFRNIFFTWSLKPNDFRQISYDENSYLAGTFNARVFFLDYQNAPGLGVIIADDWKAGTIKYYRCGSDKDWEIFHNRVRTYFQGDNS